MRIERDLRESKARQFAKTILQTANQSNINIRELEEACEIAIRFCREALVPTLESQKTTQGN